MQNRFKSLGAKPVQKVQEEEKSELSEGTKFYNQNVKALCDRLNKDKRKGTEKLAFVIMEIISAQNSGLIPKNKNHNQSKFAAIMLENVVFKLSK